eukprot:TRINITY_DN415_c0_g1_i2.p1 TRINITY_DN415_c0_g1~~TRINITY_DN415_c0_g1_i2.p1  ORF type:complete len:758 (+),score=239.69 TRINITY_DN415_c0_g1_i2:43-2274(+)
MATDNLEAKRLVLAVLSKGAYPYYSRINDDCMMLLLENPYLKPAQEVSCGKTHIKLDGMLELSISGKQYYIPVEVRMPELYPEVPPSVRVVPTQGMKLMQEHPRLNALGMCRLRSNWVRNCTVNDVIADLRQAFSQQFPVYPPVHEVPQQQPVQKPGGYSHYNHHGHHAAAHNTMNHHTHRPSHQGPPSGGVRHPSMSNEERQWVIDLLRRHWVGRGDEEGEGLKVVRFMAKHKVYRVGVVEGGGSVWWGSGVSEVKPRMISASEFADEEVDDVLIDRFLDHYKQVPLHTAVVHWGSMEFYLTPSNDGMFRLHTFTQLLYDPVAATFSFPEHKFTIPLPPDPYHAASVLYKTAVLYRESNVNTNFKVYRWVVHSEDHHLVLIDGKTGYHLGTPFKEISWNPANQELYIPPNHTTIPLPKDRAIEATVLVHIRRMFHPMIRCNYDLYQWASDDITYCVSNVDGDGWYKKMIFRELVWDQLYHSLHLPQHNNVMLRVPRGDSETVLRNLAKLFDNSRVRTDLGSSAPQEYVYSSSESPASNRHEDPLAMGDMVSPRVQSYSTKYSSGKSSLATTQSESTERDLLLSNIRRIGFSEHEVPADGNCQFRAVAYHLFAHHAEHAEVRRDVVKHLKKNKDTYAPFVDEDFAVFLKRMSKPGVWGDHVTLQAAADKYKVQFNVVTSHLYDEEEERKSQRGGWMHMIRPRDSKGRRIDPLDTFWLSYCEEDHAEHYNPLSPPRTHTHASIV